ncbi:MAG TPA: hypothetical protein DCY74_06960 [Clostridiales bacterium]|nr:hypothetical protein [Clostridiales bacterium]
MVNVSFCGTITGALTTEKDLYVGGLCGVSLNSKVYNSYTVSNVTAIGISRVFSGGLSGFLNGGELLNCFSSGNVTASTKDVSNVFVEACVARVYNQGVVKGCYWKKGSIIKSNQSEKKNKRGVDESVGIKGQSIGSYDTEWILTATDGTQLQYGDSLIAALNVFTDSNEEFAPWSDHGKLPVLIYIEASASTITTQPGDISVTLHQINGQLEVKIQEESGYLYQYQWYLDGVAIKGATASVFNIPSDLTYETNGKHTGFCRITSYMINSGKTADIFTEVSHIQLVCVHHFQGEPTILKEAGPGVEGAVAYVCTICKETEIEVIPAQPRNIRLWIYLFAGICILVCSAFLYMKTAKNK